jgi:hypothetical protein
MQDARCKMQDARCKMQDARCRIFILASCFLLLNRPTKNLEQWKSRGDLFTLFFTTKGILIYHKQREERQVEKQKKGILNAKKSHPVACAPLLRRPLKILSCTALVKGPGV